MKPIRILILALATVLAAAGIAATTPSGSSPVPTEAPKGSYIVEVKRVKKSLVVSPEDVPDAKVIKEFVEDLIPLKDGETVRLQVSRKGSDVNFKPLDRKISPPK